MQRIDLDKMLPTARYVVWGIQYLSPALFWCLRRLPLFRVPRLGWVIAARYDEVDEVLSNDKVFPVPYLARCGDLPCKPPFVLAMERTVRKPNSKKDERIEANYDGCTYKEGIEVLRDAFRETDLPRIRTLSHKLALKQLDAHKSVGKIDAIQALVRRVPTLLIEEYYGINSIADETHRRDFESANIVVSSYMFGPPGQDGSKNAKIASTVVRDVLDEAIEGTHGRPDPDTVLGRMLARNIASDQIRAHLWGMITGFGPTNTLATGNILEFLLRRPSLLEKAKQAAHESHEAAEELERQEKEGRLTDILFEALRFRPGPPLGLWRRCAESGYVLADGTWGRRRMRKGDYVLAATQSAMFDSRRMHRPREFIPGRSSGEYMYFGHEVHKCVGQQIAKLQITQTMKALLLRNPRPAPGAKFERNGYFPKKMDLLSDA